MLPPPFEQQVLLSAAHAPLCGWHIATAHTEKTQLPDLCVSTRVPAVLHPAALFVDNEGMRTPPYLQACKGPPAETLQHSAQPLHSSVLTAGWTAAALQTRRRRVCWWAPFHRARASAAFHALLAF